MGTNDQQDRVQRLVTEAMRGSSSTRVPCIGLQFVSRNGEPIAEAYGGSLLATDAKAKQVNQDSVFWTASATKLVTAIAFLQCLETSSIDIYSADFVDTMLPELKSLKVLRGFTADGSPVFEDQETRITSHMLITHQAGMTYTFLNENLWRYVGYDYKKDENHDGTIKGYMHPLISQPGSGFVYSIGHDWIGILIERHTGMKLGDYCKKHIFDPLGLKSISFMPNHDMLSNLVSMHMRLSNGEVRERKHLMRAASGPDTGDDHQHSGGGGIFSTLPDFCQILAVILNDGLCAKTQNRILQKKSVDLLLTNQIEDFNVRYGNKEMPAANYEMVRPLPEPTRPELLPNRGFGFGVSLEGDRLERAYGVGLANTYWSLDREKGVAGIISSSIIPLNEPVVLDVWKQAQDIMYSRS